MQLLKDIILLLSDEISPKVSPVRSPRYLQMRCLSLATVLGLVAVLVGVADAVPWKQHSLPRCCLAVAVSSQAVWHAGGWAALSIMEILEWVITLISTRAESGQTSWQRPDSAAWFTAQSLQWTARIHFPFQGPRAWISKWEPYFELFVPAENQFLFPAETLSVLQRCKNKPGSGSCLKLSVLCLPDWLFWWCPVRAVAEHGRSHSPVPLCWECCSHCLQLLQLISCEMSLFQVSKPQMQLSAKLPTLTEHWWLPARSPPPLPLCCCFSEGKLNRYIPVWLKPLSYLNRLTWLGLINFFNEVSSATSAWLFSILLIKKFILESLCSRWSHCQIVACVYAWHLAP